MVSIYSIALIVSFFCLNGAQKFVVKDDQVLIVVSYDAFRNEYFSRNVTNFMNNLKKEGTRTNYMRNVFPTKTFPNHHSIATGVYPDKHGVMANSLFDNKHGKLGYSYKLFHFNEDILPVWTLNEMAGKHSGCMMWPGSDYPYTGNNVSCTYTQVFNISESELLPNMAKAWEKRVDTVISWIRNPEKPANLIMFYVEEPDLYAHAFGPESDLITQIVVRLNNLAKYLHDKIHENNLQNRVNVLHMSDHGMDSLMPRNFINLTDFVPSNLLFKTYGTTPILQVVPNVLEHTDKLYDALLNASLANKHFSIYKKDTLPARWHFGNAQRTGPITAVAKLGYGFGDMWDSVEYYRTKYNITVKSDNKYGVHGYDNEEPAMHPFFFAYGPLIKKNFTVAPFDTIDLYFLFCEILKLQPPPYLSGNREHVIGILKDDSEDDIINPVTPAMIATIFIGSLLSSFILVSFLASTLVWQRWMRARTQVPSYLYDENESVIDEQNKLLANLNNGASINGDVVNIEI